MEKTATGTIISAKKQWWLKVNTKMFRTGPLDGAVFPYIVKVRYTVDGREYTKAKWIRAGDPVPAEGETVNLVYDGDHPENVRII